MKWNRLSSPQLDTLDRALPVILPTGSTEQHGPHLPMGTDLMVVDHLCSLIDQAIEKEVLILPSLSVTCSKHHMDFPGSLTLSHETHAASALEILESVRSHGFKNFLLFNSHGGNTAINTVIMEQFGNHNPDCHVASANWYTVAAESLAEIRESPPGGVGHAGEFETSLMMVITPDLVDTSSLPERGNNSTFPWSEADLLKGSKAKLHRTMKQMTDNGVFGDPGYASVDKAHRIEQAVLEHIVPLIKDLKI